MKNKKLVLTLSIGEEYEELSKITHPIIKKYADKIGADFHAISEQKISDTTPHWEKFQIYNLLNKYDRILYVDTDIIIRDDCPDLFEEVDMSLLGAFNEAQFTQRNPSFYKSCETYGINYENWNGEYYNTGVMVLSRIHKQLFKKPELEYMNFFEQGYINAVIHRDKIKTHNLSYKFNRVSALDVFTGEDRFASYIVHYAGAPNIGELTNLIKSDIARWEKDSPNYEYKKHIYICVQGGLGDQIDAEPAIRFLINNVYDGEDILIATHFPKIFSHLPAQIVNHDDIKSAIMPDTAYLSLDTLPDTEKPLWQFASQIMMHTTDFCSLSLMRRILPSMDKQIYLESNIEDFISVREILPEIDINNSILVHPGRGWKSKTFPEGWWKEIIDGISKKGINTIIIGKDEGGDIGVQLFEIEGDNIFDLRNRLNLGEFISIISQAKVLISSDSSPIHVAGAFDNYIIVIPSAKHPEHVLPFRNGSVWYKSAALYNKLTLDGFKHAPSEIYGTTADGVVGDIMEYLPNAVDVIEKAEEFFHAE